MAQDKDKKWQGNALDIEFSKVGPIMAGTHQQLTILIYIQGNSKYLDFYRDWVASSYLQLLGSVVGVTASHTSNDLWTKWLNILFKEFVS